jgi:hypothetical protein
MHGHADLSSNEAVDVAKQTGWHVDRTSECIIGTVICACLLHTVSSAWYDEWSCVAGNIPYAGVALLPHHEERRGEVIVHGFTLITSA